MNAARTCRLAVALTTLVVVTSCAPAEPVCGDVDATTSAVIAVPSVDPIATDTAVAPPDIRLTLNVPAYAVTILRSDSVLGRYAVAVGSPRYPTRLGSFTITSITWNPWWRPPPSPWARDEKVTPPGPLNPMGKVKLNYGAAYYLHGTPDSTRLQRAVSHGCVRMQNADAIDLALRLQDLLGLQLPDSDAAEVLADWRKERTIVLKPGVPLEVRYDVVEIRDSTIYTYRDIYGREQLSRTTTLLLALDAYGVAPERIDTSAVSDFVVSARGSGQVHLRTLLLGHFATPAR